MTCLYKLDYSSLFSLLPSVLEPVHTWATSMQMDVTRKQQPRLRTPLLKMHVESLKLRSRTQSKGYDAKRWLQSVPAQLIRKE